ncbi:MAG: SDR family NAD(P)-dependent oxidoreductase [Armatimonadetes bacterium]|nr:SDR family NAD(P)-dependent oxidoreductase [Armatimonadota bacterium]
MNGKTALVTGSSRGIGAEIARQLVHDDWQVILHCTNGVTEAHVLAESLGDACLGVVKADLRSPEETEKLWLSAREMAPIDALVNNAGVYIQSPFGSDAATWQKVRNEMMRVNFEAPTELIYAALQDFEGRGKGKVLNVASRVGFRGEANAAFYAASKAALINLTRSLAVEYANSGIEFFGLAPGWVDTSMARDGMDNRLKEILATIPMGRMASPADCAATASFLLSDAASYLSGVVIDINGASYFH